MKLTCCPSILSNLRQDKIMMYGSIMHQLPSKLGNRHQLDLPY